jgi:hypothetical protein
MFADSLASKNEDSLKFSKNQSFVDANEMEEKYDKDH